MERQGLNPKLRANGHHHDEEEEEDDYVYPQMNYCCGSRGIELSPKLENERTQSVFVSLVFVIKLIQVLFVAFFVYDLDAEGDQLKFNITVFTAEEVKSCNWLIGLAAVLVIVIFSWARCGGAGRGFFAGLFLNLLKTLGICVFCGTLITFDFLHPYRFIVFLAVAMVCLVCLGICLLTSLLEMNVMGRGMYSALFIYGLLIFLLAHFAYVANLRAKYSLPYLDFIIHVGAGGGAGLFIGMVMFWYVQELISGNVVSLNEMEYLYVNLLI